MTSHYRQPFDWTAKGVEQSLKTLDKWYDVAPDSSSAPVPQDVMDALSDDLNTPLAVTLLHGLAKTDPAALKSAANLLGLLTLPKEDWQKLRARSKPAIDPARIESLIAARNAARAARDFGESDRIRDALAAMGVTLKDGPDGTRWEI